MTRPACRQVLFGEPLAMDPRYLVQGPEAFFWLFGPSVLPNEYLDDGTAVVHIRGPLEHHADSYSDSYEAIVQRVTSAWDGCDEEDSKREPAKRVILKLDSPGGVVAGLNDTVQKLRDLAAKRPFIAYAGDMAASAAYALASSCTKLYLPASGIVGSIGVISTMCSQAGADKKDGLDFRTITSGARKADGHPHMPISDAAVAAEKLRVDDLASQFFALVKKMRGFNAKPLEAAIFLGQKAVAPKVADGVMTWDALVKTPLDTKRTVASLTKPVTTSKTVHVDTPRRHMKIKDLIEQTEAAIAAEQAGSADPEKLAALYTEVTAYKKTYKKVTEERETEEGGVEEEENGVVGGGNDTDRKEEEEPTGGDPPPKKDDGKDDDEDDEEDDEEEKKASAHLAALAAKATGEVKASLLAEVKRRETAAATRAAKRGEKKAAMKSRLAAVEAKLAANDVTSRVDAALGARRITPAEAKMLKSKQMGYVEAFLAARPKALPFNKEIKPNLKADAQTIGHEYGGAPSEVVAEVTEEMREAAKTVAELSNGKITVAQAIKEYQERQAINIIGKAAS